MEKAVNKKEIIISIKRIKELSFFINEKLSRPEIVQIKSQLESKLGFNTSFNLVNLTLTAYYIYEEFPNDKVMEIVVENVFEVPGLMNFIPNDTDVTPDKMNLPSDILITMVSLSISHTRALFAKNISGTVMDSIYLPITDPIAASKAFFGSKIKDNILQ